MFLPKVVLSQGFHGANAHQSHPYKMTAQARTKRGLWGYLFPGRKIVILSFGVLEIRVLSGTTEVYSKNGGLYPGL